MSHALIQTVKVKSTGKVIRVYQIKEKHGLEGLFKNKNVDNAVDDLFRLTSSTYCDFADCKTLYRQSELSFNL